MKQALKAIQKISFWVVVLALLAYSIFPIYWMVVTSFRSTATITSDSGLWPQDPTFKNFLGLNRLFNYSEQYMNSLIVATSVTVITMLICTLVAYAIARRNFKGRKTLTIALLFSYMFPPLLTLIPLYVYMVKAGLGDTLIALIIVELTVTMPLGIWMLWGFFKSMPFQLEEAAMIDGCSRLGAFVRIMLPLAKPGMITVAIFSFLISWNGYLAPTVMIESDSNKTLQMGLTAVSANMTAQWGLLMAACTMIVAPLVVGFLLLNRYFIQGLAGAGVKG